jgi:hypothetical protein
MGGGPFGLGWKCGCLQFPSLADGEVVVLGLLLYCFLGAARIVLSVMGPGRGQLVPRCYRFLDSPST